MLRSQKLLAQITNPVIPPSIGAGGMDQGGIAVGAIIRAVMGGLFIVAFLVAFIYLMTGAFHWITSGGDKASLEHARNKIIHAIVGLVVISAVVAIMNVLGDFFGIDFMNLPIPVIPN